MKEIWSSPLFILLSINALIVVIFILALVFIGISQYRGRKTTKQSNDANQDHSKEMLNSTEICSITNTFKKRLNSLLTVKSLVTLILTELFAYLAIDCRIDKDEFMTVYTVIIAFYFGTQVQKNQDAVKVEKENPVDSNGQKIG